MTWLWLGGVGHLCTVGPLRRMGARVAQGSARRERGGGSGTQKFVDQKGPNQNFPDCKFSFFPTTVTLVWGGGSRGGVLLWYSAVLLLALGWGCQGNSVPR